MNLDLRNNPKNLKNTQIHQIRASSVLTMVKNHEMRRLSQLAIEEDTLPHEDMRAQEAEEEIVVSEVQKTARRIGELSPSKTLKMMDGRAFLLKI